jgi:hypothetical protein
MISDPKLPFAESPGLPEVEPPPVTPSYARPASVAAPLPPAGLRLWLRRIGVLVFVFLCATAGVMLVILPWRPEWTDNHLLLPFPALRNFVGSGFVRGVCTGLGVLNVWIGFWEAVQYREEG